MSIPLDRLYHYILAVCQKNYDGNVIVSRFWPHGSKNLEDLRPLVAFKNWYDVMTSLHVYCHDQEPLNYEIYQDSSQTYNPNGWETLMTNLGQNRHNRNINQIVSAGDHALLIHSEKRSKNLTRYLEPSSNHQSTLLGVYYWSHAVIARDWFRYAEHCDFKKQASKTFLIYNRAWSGTREYRLKFSDLLIDHQLVEHCKTSFSPTDNDTHYTNYEFTNSVWIPDNILENYLPINHTKSCASADFDLEDYNSTDIEVVLETLFDDERLHLTEKSLRPIACQQPFIMCATQGSLKYLQSYGFRTFSDLWDESYDDIEDPQQRLSAVIGTMKSIVAWSDQEKQVKLAHAQEIALHNQRWFFSQEFFDLVVNELQSNFVQAVNTYKTQLDFSMWSKFYQQLLTHPEVFEFFNHNTNPYNPNWEQYNKVLSYIEQFNKSRR